MSKYLQGFSLGTRVVYNLHLFKQCNGLLNHVIDLKRGISVVKFWPFYTKIIVIFWICSWFDQSSLFRPFGDLKFCGFSLLKIKIGWVLWCIKVQVCNHFYCELMFNCLLFTNLNHSTHGLWTPNEGTNLRYLKKWADVADKICCRHT